MHSPLRAAVRLTGLLGWMTLVVPPYAVLLAFRRLSLCRRTACIFWRGMTFLAGIKVVVRGQPCAGRPVLFIANHASYLDILVLGGLLPAIFIAKKEVSQWPGIGLVAKLGRTLFVERRARHSATQRDEMLAALEREGEAIILFPEGTSNDGNRVLPFKSALLSVAERKLPDGRHLPVQPISVAYTRLDGIPMGWAWRPFFAWYGDMELASHLWTALGLGRTTVEVDFHPPVSLDTFASRKALTDHCYNVIKQGVVQANCGRPLGFT